MLHKMQSINTSIQRIWAHSTRKESQPAKLQMYGKQKAKKPKMQHKTKGKNQTKIK